MSDPSAQAAAACTGMFADRSYDPLVHHSHLHGGVSHVRDRVFVSHTWDDTDFVTHNHPGPRDDLLSVSPEITSMF